jgi:PAT family beta-lactamase induction signal transducer AmpG
VASGLPLLLTGTTLQAWLKQAGVELSTIGLFALTGLPYTLKFLWSPLVDRFALPPGRRRGWILAAQGGIALLLVAMAFADPVGQTRWLAALALGLAFASATQDIATDAYRTELLAPRWQGLGTSLHIFGYRAGMIAAGAGAMVLADRIGWRATYLVMAALLIPGMVAAGLAPEAGDGPVPRTLVEAVMAPLRALLRRPGAAWTLAFIALYKLGDTLGLSLAVPFLLERGFSLTQIGLATKGVGLVALILGGFTGGWLLSRWPLRRALVVFGVAQALPCLALWGLSRSSAGLGWMLAVVATENLGYGLGTVALTALLMRLCDRGLVATQFAVLSSLAALSRVLFAAPAGYVAQVVGWGPFFLLCLALATPGLLLASRWEIWGPRES